MYGRANLDGVAVTFNGTMGAEFAFQQQFGSWGATGQPGESSEKPGGRTDYQNIGKLGGKRRSSCSGLGYRAGSKEAWVAHRFRAVDRNRT